MNRFALGVVAALSTAFSGAALADYPTGVSQNNPNYPHALFVECVNVAMDPQGRVTMTVDQCHEWAFGSRNDPQGQRQPGLAQ